MKKLLVALFFSAAVIPSFISSPAFAQSRCNQGSDPIGTVCYIEKEIGLRVSADETRTDSYDVTVNPDHGYVLLNREEWVERSAFGTVSRPEISFTRGYANFEIRRSFNNFGDSLRELRVRYEEKAKGRFDGEPGRSGGFEAEALRDYLNRQEQNYSSAQNSFVGANTNIDVIEVSASVRRRCTRTVVGQCLDYEGGSLRGVLRLYQLSVGTPAQYDQIISQGFNLLEQIPSQPSIISGNGNSNPSYIVETPGQPAVAVFESRRESFALGCSEIRDAWGVTDRRGVSNDEFQRVIRANPVVADLPCDGSIQWMKLSDEAPQLLWIRHRDGQMCRHYINSTTFPNALRSGSMQRNDGPTFRATYPCRGNDLQVVN